MSPILVRPVREQLEHDRVIRLLQVRWKRRFQVGMNLGLEQIAGAGPANLGLFPDLVLTSLERANRLEGTVEVETGESVNSLEALAQWARYARLRVPFYLYVPNGSVDAARRLCAEYSIQVAEIWSYYMIGDQMRFTQVYRAPAPEPVVHRVAAPAPARQRPVAAPRRKTTAAAETSSRRTKPAERSRAKKSARKTTTTRSTQKRK